MRPKTQGVLVLYKIQKQKVNLQKDINEHERKNTKLLNNLQFVLER